MGYYASGDGIATFKDGVEIEKVEEMLDDILDKMHVIGFEFEIFNKNQISIYDTDKYYEDETLAFLNALSPYIIEGQNDIFRRR